MEINQQQQRAEREIGVPPAIFGDGKMSVLRHQRRADADTREGDAECEATPRIEPCRDHTSIP